MKIGIDLYTAYLILYGKENPAAAVKNGGKTVKVTPTKGQGVRDLLMKL